MSLTVEYCGRFLKVYPSYMAKIIHVKNNSKKDQKQEIDKNTTVQKYKCTTVQKYKCTNVQKYKRTKVQMYSN